MCVSFHVGGRCLPSCNHMNVHTHPCHHTSRICLTSRQLTQLPLTGPTTRSRADLTRTPAPLIHTPILLTNSLTHTARPRNRRHVAIIAIDAHEVGADAVDADVLDNNVTRSAIVGAVAAGAVHFADVDEGCGADGYGPAAVVLYDFVGCRIGATAFPEDVAAAKGGDCVY